jgi:hypothetical protein
VPGKIFMNFITNNRDQGAVFRDMIQGTLPVGNLDYLYTPGGFISTICCISKGDDMKLGLGLYRPMLTPENFRFARQAGARI